MYSLRGTNTLRWVVLGLGAQSALGAVVPTPVITAAPVVERQDPNAIELASVLLTALPASLRQIAATNIPAVSRILWSEFLDDNKPDWFKALPSNIQSYLIVQYGPSTAWPTSTPSSSSISSTTVDSSTITSAPAASATTEPESPSESSSGLSMGAKIGIGIGVPLGVLALLAIIVPFCIACRKKKPKKTTGYEPPPSPGFMPHGAFHEKSTSYQEYRAPLNRSQSWGQDDEMWMQPVADDAVRRPQQNASMPMGNSTTIVGPPLVHTHSSNRARGKRTSHSSLHAVAEVSEPDEERSRYVANNGRPRHSSMPSLNTDVPQVPVGASIKRKPLSTAPVVSPIESPATSPVADRGSYGHFSLLRPAILQQDHSGSSSSGLAATFSSPEDSRRSSANTAPTDFEPQSPVTSQPSHQKTANPFTTTSNDYTNLNRTSNPFTNDHAYIEDYGPEYQSGYADVNDGLYGGHRSLDAYPAVPEKSERRGSKTGLSGMTEWPLRDWPLKSLGSYGRGRRESSPQWDRVYE